VTTGDTDMGSKRSLGISVAALVLVLAGVPGVGAASSALADGVRTPGWAIQALPTPSLAPTGHLSGVSCVTAVSCSAVGYSHDGHGVDVSLAERWDGSRWTIQPTLDPRQANDTFLTGVSVHRGGGLHGCRRFHRFRRAAVGTGRAVEWPAVGTAVDAQPRRRDRDVSDGRVVHVADRVRCRGVFAPRKPDDDLRRTLERCELADPVDSQRRRCNQHSSVQCLVRVGVGLYRSGILWRQCS